MIQRPYNLMSVNPFYRRIIKLAFSTLILLFSAITQATEDTSNLQTRWQLFFQQASNLAYETKITLEQLNRYPIRLLLSSNQFPNFEDYDWTDIQGLWQLQQTCNLLEKTTISDIQQRPKLARAIQFETALCNDKALDDDWFAQGEMLHPTGGSYADHYLRSLDYDKQAEFITTHDHKLTLSNPSHPLHELLDPLSSEGSDRLLSGYRAYLAQDGKLWLNGEFGLMSIKEQDWRQLLSPLEINIESKANAEQVCNISYSNLCIQPISFINRGLKWLIAMLALVSIGFFSVGVINHRNEAKEREFILQLLTHELRTPITSLGFTVELFRRHFDQFDNKTQRIFGRLLADHQRLSQLTETSKGFLSTDPHIQYQKQTAYLSDWLDHCLDKYNLDYKLDNDQELTLPYYWLGICLENLLKNALQHGKGDVTLFVYTNQYLRIEVIDQGQFPNRYHRLMKKIRPTYHHDNMGMGLTIVTRLMKKMGGRFVYKHNPTRCILELPL
ncbi:sensor histidine kinase [Moritella sp. F3]|nr:sensor histidine kinase [Moritella sp. F1]GIC80245.1 sensor histidine kinase [Moritella sp. F3]